MPTKQKTTPQRQLTQARHLHDTQRHRSVYITLAIFATLAVLLIATFQLLAFVQYQNTSSDQSDDIFSFLQKTTSDSDKTVNTTAAHYVQSDTIQAVFLTNGQVYFGRITTRTDDVIILDDAFYPKAQSDEGAKNEDASADATAEAGGVTLRKLGKNEFHEPQDTLYIEPKNVLYWENLKKDSRVTKGIIEYEAKQKPQSPTVTTTPATETTSEDVSAKKEASEATANINASITSEEDPTNVED